MAIDTPEKDVNANDDRLAPRVKLVIGLMLVSSFIVVLNETIMGVAIPRLMTDLDISATTAQWLTTGFLLTMAIVIPITGRLQERFTTRALFIGAMSLFTAGTVLAAVAPGFGVLLMARIVQAMGTAVMLPLLMTTVLKFVPASRRGSMMGLISIVISVAPAIGPTISGLILDALDWRWMFIIVAPIAAVALILGAVLVKNISETRSVPFDVLSIVLSALGFGGLIYGLSGIGEAASGDAIVSPFVPLAVGVVALAWFVRRQTVLQRRDLALMNLRPFATPSFSVAVVLIVISVIALFGSLIILPLYLQTVLAFDTLQTGLMLLPGGLLMGLAAPLVGRIFDRFGPRPLVIPGAVVLSAALWAMTTFGEATSASTVIAVHIVLSLGLALMLTPLLTTALGSLPSDLYAHGSAIVNTLQQVAGAAGTALFITLLTTSSAAAAEAGSSVVTAQAAGVNAAFVCGAIVSLGGIVLALFVKRTSTASSSQISSH